MTVAHPNKHHGCSIAFYVLAGDFDARMKKETQLAASPAQNGFQTESQILALVGVSRRTLKNWRDRGLIPFVKLPGSRRILFDWESVRAALLRRQTSTATGE